MKMVLLFVFFSFTLSAFGLDLNKEHIHKITDKKKAVYFSAGIFHNGDKKADSKLKAVRHSYSEKQGYERLVLDFEGNQVPKIYGGLLKEKKQLHLDFFKVLLASDVNSFGKSIMVDGINFFPVQGETLAMEINFKQNIKLEMFTLENPGRLVIDVMKN